MSKAHFHDTLLETAKRMPAKEALISTNGDILDYRTVCSLAFTLAANLQGLGVGVGDRVGIFLPKTLLSAIAPYAVSLCGATFVPINHLLRPAQIAHIVHDCGVKALITSADRLRQNADGLADVESLEIIVLSEAIDFEDRYKFDIHIWDGLAAKPDTEGFPIASVAPEASSAAALLYTSGSTGNPKGVIISHQNLLDGIVSVTEYLQLTQEDRILAVLPFSFDYGLNQLTTAIAVGATCVLFEYLLAKDILKAIIRHQITGLAGVPTIWHQLAGLTWPDGKDQTLRYLTNSGGELSTAVLAKIRELFVDASPVMMYGLTEAFRSTYLPPEKIDERPGSIGIPIPGANILVINSHGKVAVPNEEGELVHYGKHVTGGYWNNPLATEERFKPILDLKNDAGDPQIGVWSGDIVRSDDDGYLYFVGRRDGLIKTSGYRVSPEEIENAAYLSAVVAQAAAFGVDDQLYGQAIILAIVPSANYNDENDDLREFCRRTLPSYMVPREVLILSEMPVNPNGKIDRTQVALQYEAIRSAAGELNFE